MVEPPWWRPDRYAERRPNLLARARIVTAIRRFFDERGFVEVETPALQVSPGLEPHLTAFETAISEPFRDGPVAPLYLHTSPEFAMKKLLAAGEERIFQIARCYRNEERSPTHHPEFAMLEWYRAGAGYRDLWADCEELLAAVAEAAGVGRFARAGRTADPRAPWTRIGVCEAFAQHAGVDLAAAVDDTSDPAPLVDAARSIGVWTGPRDRWEDVFFRIFLARVEPHLGIGAPAILYDYPASMAALARLGPDHRFAERFEVFVCGLELANGYGELTDPAEQRARFEVDRALRTELHGSAYPVDEDFLAALGSGLPECAGIALGVDRLIMLATGAARIEDVLWAPVAEPR